VESLEGFEFEGKLYHTSCFCCTICSGIIDMDVGFQKIDQKPVCASCFKKKPSGKCAGCSKALSGSVVTFNDSKYHTDCFVCSQCRKAIGSGGFTERASKPICSTCAAASASSAPATRTVITSAFRTGGFVVDPRTGQKKPTTPQ